MRHESNERKSGLFRKPILWLVGALPLLMGCVYSLQPWYSQGTASVDPGLLGVWREIDGENTWVFLEAGDSLRLIQHGENELGEFAVVSFTLSDWSFLDLTPTGCSAPSGTVGWYLYPLHGIHRWQLRGDTLILGSLDTNLLEERLDTFSHPPFQKDESRWVFTGTRAEMAGFVPRLIDEALFDDLTVLVRP